MTELQASAEQSDRLHVAIIAGSTLTPRDSQQQAVQAMLDDLLSWGQALAALRDQDEATTERAA